MSRLQLALNVVDLEASVDFYRGLFGVEPAKRRPGYANFAIAQPPLKLVLIETTADVRGQGPAGALNHLGVEVADVAAVDAARARVAQAGMESVDERDTVCCFARQDKVWVHDPAGAPWEVYTVLEHDPAEASGPTPAALGPDVGQAGLTVDAQPCCTPAR